MKFYIYKDKSGAWRWYLKARNGRIVADSGEGYVNYQDCVDGIELVASSKDAPIVKLNER
jgi:uncharacterized protein YegP (UPF0339 family)